MLQKDLLLGNRLPVLQKRIWQLMPGKIRTDPLIMYINENISLLRAKYSAGIRIIPDLASFAGIVRGYIIILCEPNGKETRFAIDGPNDEAGKGHLKLIQFFREHKIYCNERGANNAARHGHLEVIQYLRRCGIHCTEQGADMAAWAGHFEIIQDLQNHNISCSGQGMCWANANKHWEIVKYLQAHRINARDINIYYSDF